MTDAEIQKLIAQQEGSLTLRRDAAPEIPVVREAKAGITKLQ